jgi:hypothetical protein
MEQHRIYPNRKIYNKLLQQATKEANNKNQKQSIFHTLVKHLSVNTIPTADFSFLKSLSLALSRWKSDFHQFRDTKLTVSDWAKNLLLYEDGRFAKDKMWPFYVLNFATRKKKPNQRRIFH